MLQPLIDKLLKEGRVKADTLHSCDQLCSEFRDLGLPVNVTDYGVELVDIADPLNHELISSMLLGSQMPHTLEVHQYIDSTNQYLASTFKDGDSPTVCLAEYQLKGHGRRGSQWCSTYGKDLCCSIAWPIPSEERVTGVTSLIIALSLATALEELGLDHVEVKWPNDIFVGGRKIAGILIEQIFNGKKPTLIVGVGLNLFRPLSMGCNQKFISTSVEEEQGFCDRNRISAKIIAATFSGLSKIMPQLNEALMLGWLQHDYLRGKNITIQQEETSHGLYQGIDSDGRLILNVGDRVVKFSSGHITEILE